MDLPGTCIEVFRFGCHIAVGCGCCVILEMVCRVKRCKKVATGVIYVPQLSNASIPVAPLGEDDAIFAAQFVPKGWINRLFGISVYPML